MLAGRADEGMGHEDVPCDQLSRRVSAGRTILDGGAQHEGDPTIADRITVLQRGAVLAEGVRRSLKNNPQVMEAYYGTTDGQLQGALTWPHPHSRNQGLQAWYGESRRAAMGGFAVQPGEVVTLLGRNGAGRTSTSALMGLTAHARSRSGSQRARNHRTAHAPHRPPGRGLLVLRSAVSFPACRARETCSRRRSSRRAMPGGDAGAIYAYTPTC